MLIKFIIFFTAACFFDKCDGKLIQIFHVTDFHYDANYSRYYGNEQNMCHNDTRRKFSSSAHDLGEYGNYLCDSPASLVVSAIAGMSKVMPNPHLIVWTGDSVPHVDDTQYGTNDVISSMAFVTEALKKQFPYTRILPVHGNHDYWKSNQQPDSANPVYKAAYENWKQWLDSDNTTMQNYGYYRVQMSISGRQHFFLGLNTNLYYAYDNTVMRNAQDPGLQLEFMRTHFESAANDSVTHIIAHIPPGAFERNAKVFWFRDAYSQQYNALIAQNRDKIGMQLYGHGHTDSFRLIKDETGKTVDAALLAPSVTPWKSTLAGAGANNPAFRLLTVDDQTGKVVDYTQYYLNLTLANKQSTEAVWQEEYTLSTAYSMTHQLANFSDAFDDLFKRLSANDTLFQQYYQFNSVNYDMSPCKDDCRMSQLCAIEFVDAASARHCYQHGAAERNWSGSVISMFLTFLFTVVTSVF